MAKFNYQNAQKTALRLIDQFGQAIVIVRASGDYDAVTGTNSNQTFRATNATAVSLPSTNGISLTGDNKFLEELKKGKIRGFYVAARDITFNPEAGDILLFEEGVWEIGGGTPLNPAGTPVLFTVGCRSSGKYDWATLVAQLELIVLNPYYYFDPSSLSAGPVTSWDSRITGGDNGVDLTITQATSADQPTASGVVVTFNDVTDHLAVPAGFVEPADASWQIVGTSLGTFAYKVNANEVSELNLLGNLGGTAHRKSGDLYGIILLPSSATGKDIQESRKLLIDKGATDGATGDVTNTWRERRDIVQFDGNMSDVTSASSAWQNCTSLTSFSSALPLVTNASYAWFGCSSLASFSSELPLVTNASNTWQSCSSLTSFTSDLPLATNVVRAWQNCSSLTSFSSALPSVTNASYAWDGCSSLTSFTSELPSVTNLSTAWNGCSSLTSFSSDLSSVTIAVQAWFGTSLTSFSSALPSATNVYQAWKGCRSLTSFSSELPLVTNVSQAWLSCTSLTDFSAGVFDNWNPSSISSGVFNVAWDGCTSLTAQSVENILTSIDSSGKHATSTGASGGSALADAGIDIDYDGTTLSAATNTAVTSLKSKGWSIIVNNVTL